MRPTLLIRADAGPEIGVGHVMRCLALAQAWQHEGGDVHFGMAQSMPLLEERLAVEGMEVHQTAGAPGSADDAIETAELATRLGARWLVLDGYRFDAAFQRRLRQAQLRSLVIDDCVHADYYWADLVLNQNLHAHESLYQHREPHTGLLLGPRYLLLRREFWSWRHWQRQIEAPPRRVLVTLGGGDTENVTGRVIDALRGVTLSDLEAVIIAGPGNPHYEALGSAIQEVPFRARLERNAADMPALMAWADVAVTAGGSTCWETAFMGLPALILILAENQRPVAHELSRLGIGLSLGWHQDVTAAEMAEAIMSLSAPTRRAEMSERGRRLVAGDGGIRVARAMLACPALRARPVNQSDAELLFEWANDPVARQMSFHSEPIGWEEHRQWFNRVLASPDSRLFIAEQHDQSEWRAIGQVRIDGDGTVSLSLSPAYRGRRLAAPALQAVLAYYRASYPAGALIAYIKPVNEPSRQVFVKSGFQFVSTAQVAGQTCEKYVLPPPGLEFVERAHERGLDVCHS